ncbi:hypothetical protein CR513_23330, partial [Mucuna pruriens]
MVYKLKKCIYVLRHASHQCPQTCFPSMSSDMLPINDITNFIKSLSHIVMRQIGSKYVFLYVDDILLVSSDIGLLHETKRFLTKISE